MTYVQGIILGALQGVTELFPISSLGHSVILPPLLGWALDQNAPFFLTFLVATHAATALVLFLFFIKDWVRILREHGRVLWLLVVATIPAGILGLLLEKKIASLLAAPMAAAVFLVLNGLMLYGAEYMRKRDIAFRSSGKPVADAEENIGKLTWGKAFGIGCAQALALIPGLSRTGASLSGGLLAGLSHEDAARFTFLLATPVIGGAAILKLPGLVAHASSYPIGPIIAGAIAAAIGAYVSVRFLVRYFETKTLKPFALYCVAAGVIAVLAFITI